MGKTRLTPEELSRLHDGLCGVSIGDGPCSCIVQWVVALQKEADDAKVQISELRESVSRLNRRCQDAESAARTRLEEVQRAGPSLGRALAGWAAGDYKRQLEDANRRTEDLRLQLQAAESNRLKDNEELIRQRDVALGKAADAEKKAMTEEERWRDTVMASRQARDVADAQVVETRKDRDVFLKSLNEEIASHRHLEGQNHELKAALLDASRLLALFVMGDLKREDVKAFMPRAEALVRGAV